MIKYFCDWCTKETKNYYGHADTPFRLFLRDDTGRILKAEITISLNGAYNAHHICIECALKICKEGKQ